ncbi:hypothetical protein [Cohnella nanjingensis]|uniref:Uncharacterized protein n=1 Tax=Cohnella nanjingensis TaxID=1387779 RepID=A0A7X0VH04_9BACL|nr:hypothetical protein [Cohnella nanjingensis]MBB6673406.1 hypothetical protein [Cohnella nanjingensis]
MELVDVSEVSPALFVTGVIFILLVGGLLSMGVLRFFQTKKRQGWFFMSGSALSLLLLVLIVDRWFS